MIYIVDLEAVDTRYTSQWKTWLPIQLKKSLNEEVKVISGGDVPQTTTPGAFLNFGGTNVYKSKQLQQIANLFCEGKVKNNDYFLYTDAWNPTVIQLRYMAELLGIKIKIGGLWHAGSYDPQDFLGRLIGNQPWVRNAEQSMFDCYDHNFFATQFHVDLFKQSFTVNDDKIRIVGWPMEYLKQTLKPFENIKKENIVLFPHRIAPEKQPEIFKDLSKSFKEYKFIFAQEQQLSKDEYHKLLAKSKMVFSANLQETLGISWYEGAIVNTVPFVPDRLSYSEMATPDVLYPSEWTSDWNGYISNKKKIVSRMSEILEATETESICNTVVENTDNFFNGEALYNEIKNRQKEHSI